MLFIFGSAHAAAVEVHDETGDVQLEAQDGSRSEASGFDEIDITRVWFEGETMSSFLVGLELAGAGPPIYATSEQVPFREIHFEFDKVQYKISVDSHRIFAYNSAADLWRVIGEAEPATGNRTEGVIGAVYEIPKKLVRDSLGHPLRLDSVLENFHAVAYEYPGGTEAKSKAVDFAPDMGPGPSIQMKADPGAFGDVSVFSPLPFRASNGGPDLFLYPLYLTNHGPEPREVGIKAIGAPETWSVELPSSVWLAEDRVAVPVILSTPFGHQHGEDVTVSIQFSELDGTVMGEYPLTVHYLTIPQLAGHHPALFMHTGDTSSGIVDGATGDDPTPNSAWFNTLQEDPLDSGYSIPPDNVLLDQGSDALEWAIPMDPSLLIGMDFDLEGEAQFSIGFQSEIEHDGLTAQVDLLHCKPIDTTGMHASNWGCDQGSWFPLVLGPKYEVDISPGTPEIVEFESKPDQYGDLVPYEQGSNVLLHVELHGIDMGAYDVTSRIELLPGNTHMVLPLHEFQDPIDSLFQGLGAVSIERTSDFETKSNPGQQHWVQFQVHDQLAPRDVSLRIVGHNVDWMDIPETVRTSPDGLELSVPVDVPDDAMIGEFSEFFLVVDPNESKDSGVMAKARILVVDEPIISEGGQEQAKGIPNASMLLAFLMAGIAAVVHRIRLN